MREEDLKNKTVLVTAGPTRERLDPVRYLSNFSSGKMGYAIAQNALERGARVVLISGPVSIEPPQGAQIVHIESTLDLLDAMLRHAPECDIAVQAAAPADYRPAQVSPVKLKKQAGAHMTIQLVENPDVAAAVGKIKREDQVFVAFAAETNDLVENAASKMRRKNADMIVANDVTRPGAGFGTETNIATIITKDGPKEYGLMPKSELAGLILDTALELLSRYSAR